MNELGGSRRRKGRGGGALTGTAWRVSSSKLAHRSGSSLAVIFFLQAASWGTILSWVHRRLELPPGRSKLHSLGPQF